MSSSEGLPGGVLLLFTILIWLLFLMILLGNRHSKLNQWCFASGMCFSVGVLKEYLYYSLFPVFIEKGFMTGDTALTAYSVLTAIPYYLAMPLSITAGFYFAQFDQKYARRFRLLRAACFLPAILFCIFYPVTETRYYQLNDTFYYALVSIYNLVSGMVLTVIMMRELSHENNSHSYHQKVLISVLILVPIWCTLLSTLIIQLFHLEKYFKLWQGNLLVISLLICFYLYNAFRCGIMGTRLRKETFDLNAENRLVTKGARFTQHMLKNELAKIEWCANSILTSDGEDNEAFARIILRSTSHLEDFLQKSIQYSGEIILTPQPCRISELVDVCLEDSRRLNPDLSFQSQIPPDVGLVCDSSHMTEVLNNLIANAADACEPGGIITVRFTPQERNCRACLSVSNTGKPLSEEALAMLFRPYYTTKTRDHHTGLGLYYCRNVMLAHGGNIRAESSEEAGTTIFLEFPSPPHGRKETFFSHLIRKGK